MAEPTRRTVAVTGGVGNLGWKLLHHLATRPGYDRLIALDVRPADPARLDALRRVAQEHAPHRDTHEHGANGEPATVAVVPCDLADWQDRRWRDVIDETDAVVHFAAQNPYPEASWDDAAVSLDMTLHVALAAAESKRCTRVVFATSNHVMGRYKDPPLADLIGPGELHPGVEPGVGTVWHTGETEMDSTAYATAKFAGEHVCRAVAQQQGGQTTFVCVRIGWCQPGANRPDTLSASGSPTLQSGSQHLDAEAQQSAAAWFKEMWLSNRDFVHLFERAIAADATDWPEPFILVNGMSNNTGMKWSLAETRRWLGYEPHDDVYGNRA